MALSRHFKQDRLALPFSTHLSSRRSICDVDMWRHLGFVPVGSVSVSLAAPATSTIFVAIKVLSRRTLVCRYKTSFLSRKKSMLAATEVCLPRQNYVYRDKNMFDATKVCLSRQTYFCRNKHIFVATNLLSRQAGFCRDKGFTCGRSR